MTRRIVTYFDVLVPSRTSRLGALCFRHGEAERRRIVRQWLPSTADLRILDAGCGDGAFLASILAGRPARLVLEDISRRALQAASHALSGQCDAIECAARDSMSEPSGDFDVVIAVGVLDYQRDWHTALTALLRRCNGVLIANMPRNDHPRNWLRKLWFSLQGIPFSYAKQCDVERFVPCDVNRHLTRYEWFIRIDSP